MVKIKAKKEGFRRCGTAFSTQWKEFPDSHFSKAEKDILKAEPMLVMEIVEDKPKGKKSEG